MVTSVGRTPSVPRRDSAFPRLREAAGNPLNPTEWILKELDFIHCKLPASWRETEPWGKEENCWRTLKLSMVLIGGWLHFLLCWGILSKLIQRKKYWARNPVNRDPTVRGQRGREAQRAAVAGGQYLAARVAVPRLLVILRRPDHAAPRRVPGGRRALCLLDAKQLQVSNKITKVPSLCLNFVINGRSFWKITFFSGLK